MRKQVTNINSFAVGPQVDTEVLGTLAHLTGGVVLEDSHEGKSNGSVSGSQLAAAVQVPVAYPVRMTASNPNAVAGAIQMAPSTALPLRGDRTTIYLGRGRTSEDLAIAFQFAPESKMAPLTFRVSKYDLAVRERGLGIARGKAGANERRSRRSAGRHRFADRGGRGLRRSRR